MEARRSRREFQEVQRNGKKFPFLPNSAENRTRGARLEDSKCVQETCFSSDY